MLFVVALELLGAVHPAPAVDAYQKNRYVQLDLDKGRKRYHVVYLFWDPWERSVSLDLRLPRPETDDAIARFGIPSAFFRPYSADPATLQSRAQRLREGLFRKVDKEEGTYLVVDPHAFVGFFRPFCRPLAAAVVEILREDGRDTRRNRIETAMKLVQDIPYGIPAERGSLYRGGVLTPPEIFIEGYGDCDSKSYLFAGIISWLLDPSDLLFVEQPSHLLTAVRGSPRPGTSYFELDGAAYLVSETAGPGRFAWGEPGTQLRPAPLERLRIPEEYQGGGAPIPRAAE